MPSRRICYIVAALRRSPTARAARRWGCSADPGLSARGLPGRRCLRGQRESLRRRSRLAFVAVVASRRGKPDSGLRGIAPRMRIDRSPSHYLCCSTVWPIEGHLSVCARRLIVMRVRLREGQGDGGSSVWSTIQSVWRSLGNPRILEYGPAKRSQDREPQDPAQLLLDPAFSRATMRVVLPTAPRDGDALLRLVRTQGGPPAGSVVAVFRWASPVYACSRPAVDDRRATGTARRPSSFRPRSQRAGR